jgi:hypothetical protein
VISSTLVPACIDGIPRINPACISSVHLWGGYQNYSTFQTGDLFPSSFSIKFRFQNVYHIQISERVNKVQTAKAEVGAGLSLSDFVLKSPPVTFL